MNRWIWTASADEDLGNVEEAYREVLHRLTGNVLKNGEEER